MKIKLLVVAIALFSTSIYATGRDGGNIGNSPSQSQGQLQAQGQLQFQGQSSYNKNSLNSSNKNSLNSSNKNINESASDAKSNSGGNDIQQSGSISNRVDNRPAAYAPPIGLTSSGFDNCQGSAGISGGDGFFSFGASSTTESKHCNRRAYSRRLQELGYNEASFLILCNDEEVAAASPACPKEAKKSTDTSYVFPTDK